VTSSALFTVASFPLA